MIVFSKHAAAVPLERARFDDVGDLGNAQGALKFLERRHVQSVVACDAQSVDRLVVVADQRQAEHAYSLPAEALEDVEPLVCRLVVVPRHDAVPVVAYRTVAQHQRPERPRPVPRLCISSTTTVITVIVTIIVTIIATATAIVIATATATATAIATVIAIAIATNSSSAYVQTEQGSACSESTSQHAKGVVEAVKLHCKYVSVTDYCVTYMGSGGNFFIKMNFVTSCIYTR